MGNCFCCGKPSIRRINPSDTNAIGFCAAHEMDVLLATIRLEDGNENAFVELYERYHIPKELFVFKNKNNSENSIFKK